MDPNRSKKRIKMTEKRLESYMEKLDSLKESGDLSPSSASELAAEAANAYIAYFFHEQKIHDNALNALCDLAIHEDKEIAMAGENGLFRLLAERLSDSFDRKSCALYDMAFIKTIQFTRQLFQGKKIDETLSAFGLADEKDLTARKKNLSETKSHFEKKSLSA